MIKLISATVLSVAFCSSCSACWFPFFPCYSAGYPGWGMARPAYSFGYPPSCGNGYSAGYAPYSVGYAPYSSGYPGTLSYGGGCSTCASSCGGSCGSTVNYLGGVNLGCGSDCGSVNCVPDSNIVNRPVPDKSNDVPPSNIYEGDSDREDEPKRPWSLDGDRDLDSTSGGTDRSGDFRGSGAGSGSGLDSGNWQNRRTRGSDIDSGSGTMFGTDTDEPDRPSTFGGSSRRPTMEEPTTYGPEGTGEPDGSEVINRGANKPPMSDPLSTDEEAAPDPNDDGDLLAPEPETPTARRSHLFFASHRELRSSHSEVAPRQRLAGNREGNSRTSRISNNNRRSKATRWISLPMPVGQARL